MNHMCKIFINIIYFLFWNWKSSLLSIFVYLFYTCFNITPLIPSYTYDTQRRTLYIFINIYHWTYDNKREYSVPFYLLVKLSSARSLTLINCIIICFKLRPRGVAPHNLTLKRYINISCCCEIVIIIYSFILFCDDDSLNNNAYTYNV